MRKQWVQLLVVFVVSIAFTQAEELAFPGAVGWGAKTAGGRGGEIIRVTNLLTSGPGSLRAALEAEGKRIVVFEVGGVIDLNKKSIRIKNPYLTVAGQTAPSPGVTIIRGGLSVRTHDVIIQHLRIRPGTAGVKDKFWSGDALTVRATYNVVIDHCSLAWGTDENLAASGPRFNGENLEEWRKNTAHEITFSHNLVAEGLANATHPKGEHSKGLLLHDNATDILIYGNLFAHNVERSPLLKGGATAVIVNNFIYDPGLKAIHYNLMTLEWEEHPPVPGKMSIVGNVMRAGPSTVSPMALLMLGGHGDLQYYMKDNVAVDQIGKPLPLLGRYGVGEAKYIKKKKPPVWWQGLQTLPSEQVEKSVLLNAGARPWDRDKHDKRILYNVAEGRGAVIDSEEEVGGYLKHKSTHQKFEPENWDLNTMEPRL